MSDELIECSTVTYQVGFASFDGDNVLGADVPKCASTSPETSGPLMSVKC